MLFKFVLVLCITAAVNIVPQSYKSWFVSPGLYSQKDITAGFANRNPQSDTSFIQVAFLNACENYAIYKSSLISGYKLNRGTDIGTFAIEEITDERFDSSVYFYAVGNFKILDTLAVNNLICVIAGNNEIDDESRKTVSFPKKQPDWVLNLPQEKDAVYSIGVSPLYHYEASSWLTAEKTGRKSLAATYFAKVESLEKTAHKIGDTITKEEYYSELNSIQVIARYYDRKNRIFYVLLKMKL